MPRKQRGIAGTSSLEKGSGQSTSTLEKAKESIVQEEPENAINDPEETSALATEKKKLTMEERVKKMQDLRKKMADSTKANRKAVASEINQSKQNSQNQKMKQSTLRKFEKAERVLDERDAVERGEDYERVRSWNYTIEENDRWEEKMEEKEAKKDQGYLDAQSASERTYNRLVGQIKPDLKSYSDQNSNANASSSSALIQKEDSNFDQTDLQYGTHKPDDAALDRVAAHLNAEADVRAKRSRNRADDPDADVDYINNKNKHYNKKIKRFFDQHVREIRDSFERGTAL